jgi:hypothetical protein
MRQNDRRTRLSSFMQQARHAASKTCSKQDLDGRDNVAIRPLSTDGQYGVFFASHQIAKIDLTNKQCVRDVSEQVSVMSSD